MTASPTEKSHGKIATVLTLAMVVLVAGGAFFISGYVESQQESSAAKDGAVSLSVAAPSSTEGKTGRLRGNPFEMERDSVSRANVSKAFECVDTKGVVECGTYRGRSALYLAILVGDEAQIARWARSGALSDHGDAALVVAAGLGNLAAVRLILDAGELQKALTSHSNTHGPFFSNSETPDVDKHPAVTAAGQGKVDVLKFFIERGFDVSSTTTQGKANLFVEGMLSGNGEVSVYLDQAGFQMDCSYLTPRRQTYLDIARLKKDAKAEAIIARRCPGLLGAARQ